MVPIAGRGGVPAGAAAVSLNVTIVDPAGSGYATIWPCDQPQPNASNLNYQRGTIPNSVLTKLAGDGSVCIYTYATAHVLIDVNGSFPAGSEYTPLVPARVADTRMPNATIDGASSGGGADPGRLDAGRAGRRSGRCAGRCDGGVAQRHGRRSTGRRVRDRLAVRSAAAEREQPELRPAAARFPTPSSPRWPADGTVCIFTYTTTDLLVDVNGWFGGSATFLSLVPARIADTRVPNATVDGAASGGGVIPAGGTMVIPVAGRGGVPAGASAVSLNATAVDPGCRRLRNRVAVRSAAAEREQPQLCPRPDHSELGVDEARRQRQRLRVRFGPDAPPGRRQRRPLTRP